MQPNTTCLEVVSLVRNATAALVDVGKPKPAGYVFVNENAIMVGRAISDNCTRQNGVENCVAPLIQQELAEQSLKGTDGGSHRSKLVAAVTASVLCGE